MFRSIALSLLMASPAVAVDVSSVPVAALTSADVIILGEIHDNGLHHEGQAALMGIVAPNAVVFEMLLPEQAEMVNDDPRKDIAGLGKRIGWAEAGWPDFKLYQPIFDALGDLPVLGAATPRAMARKAFSDGAASVFGSDADRFGLDAPVPEAQLATRKQMQFASHCEAMPMDMMDGMVEAQRYRDAVFANTVLAALERFGSPVVLITGNGHARNDWGVPAMLSRAAPDISVYSVGFLEEPAITPDERFDATIITQAAERGDPCAAFRN